MAGNNNQYRRAWRFPERRTRAISVGMALGTQSEEFESSGANSGDAEFVPDPGSAEDFYVAPNIFWCGSVETPIWNVARELPPRTSYT